MAKVLKTAAIVLGSVALIATGIGAAIGTAGILAGISGATFATIGTIAGIGAAIAGLGARLLTKPPPARGSVTTAIWDPNAPTPYGMGEGYLGPVVRYDVGYGGTLDKVVNPYRWQVHVYSGGGPVNSISPRVDFTTIGAYYTGWIETDTQLGACPEAGALTPPMGAAPDWGAAYKLSGLAAIGWNFKFDKKGKVFANGLPTLAAFGQWAKVYDPRQDDTFPGGSGACRLGDEDTYVWSENPALHFGTYAFGRYQNGKLAMGVGLPAEGIDWTTIAAWANTCGLNDWTIFGRVFEPGDRWANLKDIAAAGGAVPAFAGAVLSVNYSAPRVALDTITEADIADEAMSVTFMQSYRNRLNTIVPKYTSADHDWQQVSAAPVQVSTYLTEDGEERREEWPFNLVKDGDQAAQLARYLIEDSRELHPIPLVLMPRMRAYRPGDCLHLDLPQLGLDHDAVMQTRSIDPATGKVAATFISETPGKHAFALGQTGTPPATPALGQTSEDADTVADSVRNGGARRLKSKTITYPLSSDDTSISVTAFSGVTDDGLAVAFPAGSMTSLSSGTAYDVFWDLTAETYSAVVQQDPPASQWQNSGLVFLGSQDTSTGGTYDPPPTEPPGTCPADDTPILLADGSTVPARALEAMGVGTLLRTKHEQTLEWGNYPIAAIEFVEDQPVFACALTDMDGHPVTIRATGEHPFLVDNRWVLARHIGTPDGTARVMKLTVTEAHTFVTANVLSHNKTRF